MGLLLSVCCCCVRPDMAFLGIKEHELDEFYAVSLIVKCANFDTPDAQWSVARVIAHLPVTDFSVLELDLGIEGHAFGPMMLHLLQIQPTIQRLWCWHGTRYKCRAY